MLDRLLGLTQVLNLGKILSAHFMPRSSYSQVSPGLFSSEGAGAARDMEGCYRDLSCFDQERKTINEECHSDGDGG